MLHPDNSKFSFAVRPQPQPTARQIQDCRELAASVEASILSIAAKDETPSDSNLGHRGDVFFTSRTSCYDDETVVEQLTYDPKHPPTKKNPTRGVTKMSCGDFWESLHYERVGSHENFQMHYAGKTQLEFVRDSQQGTITILAGWR